jgi:hypothetical protein
MNQEKRYSILGTEKTGLEWQKIIPNFIFQTNEDLENIGFKLVEERNKVIQINYLIDNNTGGAIYDFCLSKPISENMYQKISSAIEAVINEDVERTPLITTDDGVKMYDKNDTIWCIFNLYKTEYAVGNWIEKAKKDKVLQILSTKKAADIWIKENT